MSWWKFWSKTKNYRVSGAEVIEEKWPSDRLIIIRKNKGESVIYLKDTKTPVIARNDDNDYILIPKFEVGKPYLKLKDLAYKIAKFGIYTHIHIFNIDGSTVAVVGTVRKIGLAKEFYSIRDSSSDT